MEWKIERCSLGASLKNMTTLTGCRRNETLAVELELQLEKIVSPVKLQLTNLYSEAKEPTEFLWRKT